MPGFDIKTAIPIAEEGGVATMPKEFDINTALQLTEPVDSEDGYDAFLRSQFHKQIKDSINQPLTAYETKFIMDNEQQDPGAFRSFAVPYTEGIVGFFTKPFGYRPDLTRPFGLKRGPKTEAETAETVAMQKEHPVAFTLGQIISGVAPFIATAPLFPQSLLGTLGTFETVGLIGKVGQIRTEESLLMPPGEKAWELGKEAVKTGIMAPIWYYSGALKFIGRPYLSAFTRAGVRGIGTAGLETVFGTDLEQALKQGGMITALSLIFEAPVLAKTALGRGIINRAVKIAEAKGLKPIIETVPGKGEVITTWGWDVDKMDAAATRTNIFSLVKTFYNLMRTKIEGAVGPAEAAKQATYAKLTYSQFLAPTESPVQPGGAIWAPKGIGIPPPGQPIAGGMMHIPEKAPVFYSKMASALAEKMPESAPVEQVRGILQSTQIPKEEIEWSGIEEFLKGKEKVSKTELLDYLQKNQLTIEETIKGISKESITELDKARDKAAKSIFGEDRYFNLPVEMRTEIDAALEDKGYDTSIGEGGTKYSDAKYNVVTENYKEMLLRVTTLEQDIKFMWNMFYRGQRDFPNIPYKQLSPELKQKIKDIGYTVKQYKEPHWDEPNVFAHGRIADVTDSQGRKGLFVNEIQSQWALEIRKAKISPDRINYIREKIENLNKRLETEIGPERPAVITERNILQKELDDATQLPSHPVVSRWHEVILKRLLRYAAENGYDFITWATGEQVAEYYDLSKVVDKIDWVRDKATKEYDIELIKDEKIIEGRSGLVDEKDLGRFLGKDIARRIIESNKWKGSLSGENLKVGGAWAINLYNRQIPNWLNDYAKKFGAQVETVDLGMRPQIDRDLFIQETEGGYGVFTKEELEKMGMPEKEFATGEEAQKYIDSLYRIEQQQSLAITPQMKQTLLQEGQPVFGKMPTEVGKPGLEAGQMKIFRMDEEMKIVNTKGEIVTLPKGEEYRTLPVYDSEGNIVPNKVKLQDGKQVTVYEGELNKLKGKILGEGEQPMAGGEMHPAKPEEEQPKPRIEQRKEDMVLWNTPDIVDKLMTSEKEFLKKYIDEGKSLKQIAKELGESIEDTKKTEMWAYAHMQEITDELRAEIEEAGTEDYLARKGELKTYLQGQLDPELKKEGEYHNLAMLPWLWAKEGQTPPGVRPDVLASEIAGMGYPIEPTEGDVIGLIESYFKKEIEGRAAGFEAQYSKARQAELKRGLTAKVKKVKPRVPEREITGVGNGSTISTREDIDYEERNKIFKGMPFALLGNKAEVLARLPSKFKAAIKQGIKKVYDLWGGAKGYRAGLFSDIPAADYTLNELSDERYNYYKNIQDPEKQKIMKQTLVNIMNEFVALMKDAFNLPAAKDNKDFLDMLNSWLKMGLRKERYYFTKEVMQEFGDRLLQEASADKFASPESSAKYYFLENTSIFSISKTEKGYAWTQGIIRTTKGESAIRNIVDKLIDFNGQLDAELNRDQGMPVTQENAWDAIDRLTEDIKAGKVNLEETVVVIVDPQYLNPTEAVGTYSVGLSDVAWKGHKENLEKHLMPLVKTGVKIIYTNNADYELINWLRAHKLPYNINKSIGAVAERSGRDEIISFINFKLPQQYVSGVGAGVERPMGQPGVSGEGVIEPGQQYVTPRVTGQSAKFIEWLREHELKLQEEVRKQELIAKINLIAKSKMLSNITVSRIRKYLGIKEWKNTDIPQIQKLVDYLEGMKIGDKLLSERQIKVLQGLLEDVKDLAIMPKRIAIEQFGNNPQLLEGLIMSRVANELIPTVDIKEGNPLVQKIVNEINEKLEFAEEEIRRRDNQLEEMLVKAEKSRKLLTKEKIKRFFTSQNKEIFQALSGEAIELTKEEAAVVAYLKNFFAMAKEKLALQKYRRNYVTHLEQPLTEKILEKGLIGALQQYFREQSIKKEIPTDIMLELDNIIGSEKFFRFALKRKGGIEPTTNIRKIVHEYSSLFETKVALDRILPLGQVATQLIIQGRSALWLKKFLQNLKGRGLDYEFRTGKMGWLSRVADGIIDLGYIKLLSLNWRSAIKNIVAGEANAIIWQDFSAYLKGKERFFSHPKKAYDIAVKHGVLEGTYADYTQRGIGKLKKLQDKAVIGQQAGEVEIRTCMFVSELTDQEWETGNISPVKSRKLRDDIAITQGIFSKTESPLWVQTALGRMIMQMNRWRITDAMLLRRIVNGAREEWKQGNYKGQSSQRLSKALFFYAIGMYVSYELGKAGFRKAAQIAQSMAEVVNSLISLISQGDLMRMITDNPTLSVIKEFFFTMQALAKYLHVPGAQKPSKIKIQQGIEETYIAPLDTVKDIIDELQ